LGSPTRAAGPKEPATSTRRRLDAELVRRGLAPSRTRAAELVEAGRVTVAGAPAAKAARLVGPDEPVVVQGDPDRFVGRGGHKLDAALDAFSIDVTGRRFADLGASTGGFTDCLLQRGAVEVVAVDVGRGQLHERIRRDGRVVVVEGCNVRHLEREMLGGSVDGVVADLSFISLRTVAPAIIGVLDPGAVAVLLVKPQFEAGRRDVARGRGVIVDPAVHRAVLEKVIATYRAGGLDVIGLLRSPLRGASGNVEFLLGLRPGGPIIAEESLGAMLDAVVAQPDEVDS